MCKKRIILGVVVLMLAVPAWAEVLITCTSDGNEVTVSWDASTEPNLVRAFALDITVDNGVITKVTDVHPEYYIYPGSIDINDVTGDVDDWGTPVCDPCLYPGTLPGLGSNGITVEMGSLYDPCDPCHPSPPPASGVLLKFWITQDCNVTITENTTRGGVVLEDPTIDPDVNAPGCFVKAECMKPSNPDYANWLHWNRPDCWCYPRQCRGDADGAKQGPFWVALNDLAILRTAINKLEALIPPGGECADFDHVKTGPFWVSLNDLAVLRQYINKLEAMVPECDATYYNFWRSP